MTANAATAAPATGGRTVWITGAGSGVGRAVAVSAARAGARVVLTGRRAAALAETAEQVRGVGGEALELVCDTTRQDDLAQAYVRITRGCNKFCTYCVVPYTRGPEVHRPPENIVEEVRRLADAGAREVTLLGQTINHYAFRHGDGRTTSFADLLYRVHEAVGTCRGCGS